MIKTTKTFIATILLTSASLMNASAAILATWDTSALATGQTVSANTSVDADLSASQLALATMAAPGSTFPASNWPNALTALQNTLSVNSLATAKTANDYFTFSITPDAGKQFSVSSIDMNWSLGTNVLDSEITYALTSSVDSFASSIDTITAASAGANHRIGSGTFTVGGGALDDISSATEFRIYVYNTGANPGTRIGIGHSFSATAGTDLGVNGTVSAIPEPSSVVLLGIALAGLMAYRRR